MNCYVRIYNSFQSCDCIHDPIALTRLILVDLDNNIFYPYYKVLLLVNQSSFQKIFLPKVTGMKIVSLSQPSKPVAFDNFMI